jgi:hypothetical protein
MRKERDVTRGDISPRQEAGSAVDVDEEFAL